MLMSVNELRNYLLSSETDSVLEFYLQALESFIKRYTNNNFINRSTLQTEYPPDVQMGAVNLLKWDLENRAKIGIASETISRHSVTYTGMTEAESIGGYPAALIGFLKPYQKARF